VSTCECDAIHAAFDGCVLVVDVYWEQVRRPFPVSTLACIDDCYVGYLLIHSTGGDLYPGGAEGDEDAEEEELEQEPEVRGKWERVGTGIATGGVRPMPVRSSNLTADCLCQMTPDSRLYDAHRLAQLCLIVMPQLSMLLAQSAPPACPTNIECRLLFDRHLCHLQVVLARKEAEAAIRARDPERAQLADHLVSE
jgi:hypothetical protein